MKFKALLAAGFLASTSYANAAAIITDGNVSLGVADLGQLNVSGGVADIAGTTAVGLRYIDPLSGTQYESTSHGCECEGWGVGISETGETGYANNAVGTSGLSSVSFASDATTATSVVSTASLEVTHDFALSASDNLYEVTVNIENTSATDIDNLLYRRTFDWDASPTPFNEYVTIAGTATSTAITKASSDGFCNSNVFSFCEGTYVGDFVGAGPTDHGANFDFDFGALASGEIFSFTIFYGAAVGYDAALAALGTVGAEAYSLGYSGGDSDVDGYLDTGELAPTFIFGFAGVGGIKLPNPEEPEEPGEDVNAPATLGLFGAALLGLAGLRRRKI